ncbi:hypothetical protein GCM10009626_15090 [Brachybacterium sacelli]
MGLVLALDQQDVEGIVPQGQDDEVDGDADVFDRGGHEVTLGPVMVTVTPRAVRVTAAVPASSLTAVVSWADGRG